MRRPFQAFVVDHGAVMGVSLFWFCSFAVKGRLFRAEPGRVNPFHGPVACVGQISAPWVCQYGFIHECILLARLQLLHSLLNSHASGTFASDFAPPE